MRKLSNELQYRTADARFVATRTSEAHDAPVIEGFFAVYGQETELWPGAREEIAQGAFDRSIRESDVRALINHDHSLVLGRTGAGTLSLESRPEGLYGRIAVNPDDTDAMNAYARVARGDVSQASFGFTIRDQDTVHNDANGGVKWTLRDVDLIEVSVVTFPAYETTALTARRDEYDAIRQRALDTRKQAIKKRLEDMRCLSN